MANKSIKALFASLEAVSPTVNQEIEYTFFMRISPEVLIEIEKNASKIEQQEQWEHFVARPDGKKISIRVRAVNDRSYILCTKLNLPTEVGKREAELPTTKEMFEHFKVFGNTGTRKKRYILPLENGLKWEVDVYETSNGEIHPWIKLDFEVPHKDVPLPQFPFEYEEAILSQPLKRTLEENQLIEKLFSEYNLSIYQARTDWA